MTSVNGAVPTVTAANGAVLSVADTVPAFPAMIAANGAVPAVDATVLAMAATFSAVLVVAAPYFCFSCNDTYSLHCCCTAKDTSPLLLLMLYLHLQC